MASATSRLNRAPIPGPAGHARSVADLAGMASHERVGPARALGGPQQAAVEDDRQEHLAVAVLVEQHGDLVAVVTLYRARAPALTLHARAHRERDPGGRGGGRPEVVVAVPARAGVVLPEVGQQERPAAAGLLRVAAHHRQPGPLHLILAAGFRL